MLLKGAPRKPPPRRSILTPGDAGVAILCCCIRGGGGGEIRLGCDSGEAPLSQLSPPGDAARAQGATQLLLGWVRFLLEEDHVGDGGTLQSCLGQPGPSARKGKLLCHCHCKLPRDT